MEPYERKYFTTASEWLRVTAESFSRAISSVSSMSLASSKLKLSLLLCLDYFSRSKFYGKLLLRWQRRSWFCAPPKSILPNLKQGNSPVFWASTVFFSLFAEVKILLSSLYFSTMSVSWAFSVLLSSGIRSLTELLFT